MPKQDDVWFITGGATGLGLSIAQRALAAGYRVAATSRSLAALTTSLGAASDRFLPLAMEVTDEASVQAAVAAAVAHFGELAVVVNNAGYAQFGSVEEVTADEVRRDYEVNVFGALHVLRATLPHLRARGAGHVFNISSIGGLVGNFAGIGVYCSTKFALAGLTEALHAELAPFGVAVTVVYPGYFRTNFLAKDRMAPASHPLPAYAAARAAEAQHADAIHANQPGDPDKAAQVLVDVYARPDAPLHLLLGSDALGIARDKLATLAAAYDANAALTTSTEIAGA